MLVESADILKEITFMDTPGVLSGDKQRISRGYDPYLHWMHFVERGVKTHGTRRMPLSVRLIAVEGAVCKGQTDA